MKGIPAWTIAAAIVAMCSVTSGAQTPPQALDDTAFVQKAAEAGRMEVEHGKLAASKATNPQVKAYAQKLVKDHTAANQQLMAIAKKKKIEVPAAGAQTKPAAWTTETGAAFDRGFVEAQVKAHEEAVALFEKESTSGHDAELKGFATKQLPGLRTHLKQAQDLQKKLGTSTH